MTDATTDAITESKLDRGIIFILRIMIGWTFLYAGLWQIRDNYNISGFLNHVVTFHDFYANFATPAILPITNFLVKWGHLLIGLSFVSGLLVRVSGPFAFLLMIIYYFAHMEFPYVENTFNYIVDYHLVYAVVIVYLVAHRAGHVLGLDGLVEELGMTQSVPALRPLVG